jgi:hypothetical protein
VGRFDLDDLRPWPDDPRWQHCERLREEVMQRVGIRERVPDPFIGDFLSFMVPGGLVLPHVDHCAAAVPDACQVRCNVFVQKDPGSGDPLLAGDGDRLGTPTELRSGDLLVFSPSLTIHAARRVRQRSRILASFGFVMGEGAFAELLGRAAACPAPPA